MILIERSPSPLGSFAPDLRPAACRSLEARGVEIRSGALVADVDERSLTPKGGERVEAATVVWAAVLPGHHRVIVEPTLQGERHPEAYVVGGMAQTGPARVDIDCTHPARSAARRALAVTAC
jgi:NADH dehydrogenase FAD-containing subunit